MFGALIFLSGESARRANFLLRGVRRGCGVIEARLRRSRAAASAVSFRLVTLVLHGSVLLAKRRYLKSSRQRR